MIQSTLIFLLLHWSLGDTGDITRFCPQIRSVEENLTPQIVELGSAT